MNREYLSKALCEIDESFLAEAYRPVSEDTNDSPERIIHLKKKKIITFALAAALVIALGVGAYAAGFFSSKVKITTTPVDLSEDPAAAKLLDDFPELNNIKYELDVVWESHRNLPTVEMQAMLDELRTSSSNEHADFLPGTKYLSKSCNSVEEMEEAYGIGLLHLGDEYQVGGFISRAGATVKSTFEGGWASRVDDTIIFIKAEYHMADQTPATYHFAATNIDDDVEYWIRSLGVTARLISYRLSTAEPRRQDIVAFFSCDGVDYRVEAIADGGMDPTIKWLCSVLETLHY